VRSFGEIRAAPTSRTTKVLPIILVLGAVM
jgi:hypothetical protein